MTDSARATSTLCARAAVGAAVAGYRMDAGAPPQRGGRKVGQWLGVPGFGQRLLGQSDRQTDAKSQERGVWRLHRRRQAGPGAGQEVAQTLPSAVEPVPRLPVLAPPAGFQTLFF